MARTKQLKGDGTAVRVEADTWARLNMKRKPGEPFNAVIVKLLDSSEVKANE